MLRTLTVAGALLCLAACGGGGGGAAPPAAQGPATAQSGTGTMAVQISIPAAAAAAAAVRHTAAITPLTNGIQIQAYAHSDTAHANTLAGGSYDVSATSSLCTTKTARTCALALGVAAGTIDVVATAYDAAPVAGSFSAAHQLGQGTVYSVAIVANTSNAVNLVVGGTVASVVVTPATQTLTGGTAGNYNLAFTAYDARSEAIIAGTNTVSNGSGNTETDTFSNPITFQASETGGSGHTLLALNGGTHAASVTSSSSADVITVYYDGAASAGYTVAISAKASGASTAQVALSFTFGNQMLYVANRNTGSVSWFPLNGPYGNVAPTNTVGGSVSGLSDPVALAVDSSGTIYTSNDDNSGVKIFASGLTGNVAATRTFTPTNSPATEGLAVDSNGYIYESSYTTALIDVMPPTSSGSATPTHIISGASTTLSEPIGMAFDSSINLYVADYGAPAIDVFAFGAGGNVAPTNRIVGAATQLVHPGAVAIDATGRIIVADTGSSCCTSGFVLVFASGASGNVAPVAQLIGAATGLQNPSGVGIDPSGAFWISDAFSNSLSKFAANANGNVAPLVTISGAATGLSDAQKMTIH